MEINACRETYNNNSVVNSYIPSTFLIGNKHLLCIVIQAELGTKYFFCI